MMEQPEKGTVAGMHNFLWTMAHSRNLAVLREQEQRLGSPETLRSKDWFENSILCLLANLLGLSAINLARGLNPAEHQLKHGWSRPLHLFFLAATGLNLCAVGLLGYRYVGSSSEAVRGVFELAKDPRIYLDVDRVEVEPTGVVVVHHTLKEKLEKGE
jgi:hypothetical protein